MGEVIKTITQIVGAKPSCYDVGQHQMIACRYAEFSHLKATMGFTYQLHWVPNGCSKTKVVAVIGDGEMNIQELGTIFQTRCSKDCDSKPDSLEWFVSGNSCF